MSASKHKPSGAIEARPVDENSAHAIAQAVEHVQSLRKLMQKLQDEAQAQAGEPTADFVEAENTLRLALATVELRARAIDGNLASAQAASFSLH